ncbi:peptidoglycan DD-metalloendopeptidase family protein [Mycobacterium sp. NPDC050551]|uniref:M23 family metallopeptidase n=1 Tax=Mycobacterium sp. NPDC050551 TaxID=3155407 RepID=UPI003432E478
MYNVRNALRRSLAPAMGAVLIVASAGCAGPDAAPAAEPQSPQQTTAAAPRPDAVTPLVGSVPFAPVPFAGSDGRTHMVYELAVTNFTAARLTVDRLKVLDDSTGAVLGELDAAALRDRMQPAGSREGADHLEPGQAATIFIHLILDDATAHTTLAHEVGVTGAAIPTDGNRITERIATTAVDERTLPVVSAPLRGERFIAADACCDAVRHTRALLPVNGRPYLAQRYAIDYEQADAQNRIFTGNPRDPGRYAIYGEEVLAVADGTVVGTRNDLPEQTPGVYPSGIPIEEADGNFVVLDIGDGFYVNYAHMQPGSVRPEVGERVARGDVIGLVGNTGNSVAPHLHLHVMDGPSPLAAQGLPYLYDRYSLSGQVASTKDFDAAEGEGVPLVTVPGVERAEHTDQLILDQNIVDFGS